MRKEGGEDNSWMKEGMEGGKVERLDMAAERHGDLQGKSGGLSMKHVCQGVYGAQG